MNRTGREDVAYYGAFRSGDLEIGLDPMAAARRGLLGGRDIQASLQVLLDAGAQAGQEVRGAGSGKLIASVKDGDSNTGTAAWSGAIASVVPSRSIDEPHAELM